MPGQADAVRATRAPVVAVSPVVGGAVVKGPTEPFLAWAGRELSAAGVAAQYGDLLDGMVADEDLGPAHPLATLRTDTLMADAGARRRVARETLAFAEALAA